MNSRRGDTLDLAYERILALKDDLAWWDGEIVEADEFNVTLCVPVWRNKVESDTLLRFARRNIQGVLYCRSREPEDWCRMEELFEHDRVTINKAVVAVLVPGLVLFVGGGDAETSKFGGTLAVFGSAAVYVVGNVLSDRRTRKIKLKKRWVWL